MNKFLYAYLACCVLPLVCLSSCWDPKLSVNVRVIALVEIDVILIGFLFYKDRYLE